MYRENVSIYSILTTTAESSTCNLAVVHCYYPHVSTIIMSSQLYHLMEVGYYKIAHSGLWQSQVAKPSFNTEYRTVASYVCYHF